MTIDTVAYPSKWDIAWSSTPQAGTTAVGTVTFDLSTNRAGGNLSFIVEFPSGFSFDGSASSTFAPDGAFPVTTVTPAWDGTQGRFVAATTSLSGTNFTSGTDS
jgi:hypothetical protein